MKNESIKKNYVYNLIYQIIAIILPIISMPYVSKVLGAENIGIYGYALSISAYFVLFGTLGITLYGQREIAYLQTDREKYSKAFYEILFLKLIIMTISIILFSIFFINGNNSYQVYYKILFFELLAHAIDVCWLFQGLEDFKKTVTRNIIVKIVSIICIFLFVKTKDDLSIYFFIYALSILFGNLTLWVSVPKYICKVNIKSINIFKHLKPILIMFIPQVAIQIYTVLDRTMIGEIVNDKSQVGYYTQGENLIKLVLTIITALGTVMLPRIASKFAEKNFEKIKEYIYKSFNVVFLLSFPMISGIALIADMFVPKFFGPGYEGVAIIMIVLSPLLLLIGMSNVVGIQYLLPTKRQKEFNLSVIFGAVSNFIINLILIRHFYSVGAAISTIIAETIVTGSQLIYVRKELKIKEILKIASTYIVPTIIMIMVCYILRYFLNSSVISIMVITIIGILSYGISLIIFKNKFVLNAIDGILSKIKKI